MNQIVFYLQYAARNLWRNRRWSTFAVFSIAAGVAAVVALRSLGLAIGDSLTSNVRTSNHGDITIEFGGSGGGFRFMGFEQPGDQPVFTDAQLNRVESWVAERGGQMAAYSINSNVQITALDYTSAGRPQFITTIFINPATFPPTQDITAIDPEGVPLGDLFQGGNEVVISRNLAESQRIKVGDRVRASGTTEEFVVRGIVATEVQAGFRDLFSAFFGFAYFSDELKSLLPVAEGSNTISITLPEGASLDDIDSAGREVGRLVGSSSNSGRVLIRTVPDLLEQNQQIADIAGSFIVVMGLGALLIGGVGIINTMLVMVNRRTEEIASLKTFGLKGRQIGWMFMAEAVLLGLVGSITGMIFGIFLSGLANAYGQTLIQQPLAFRVYPQALLFGGALGVVISGVFGVLPVVTAVKIRPAIILRPNETHIPRAGCLQSLGMIVLVTVVVGLIAGQMLLPAFATFNSYNGPNPFLIGIVGVAVTLGILGLLIGVLWLVVWVMGRFPTFGSVDLRLTMRNLRARRLRTATTLLALSAGMFALSSITFFGAGARQILQMTLTENLGGNVMIFSVLPTVISNPMIDNKLNQLEGVVSRTRYLNYSGEITAINGQSVSEQNIDAQVSALTQEMRQASRAGDFGKMAELGERMDTLAAYNPSIAVRETTGTVLGPTNLAAGREFTSEDRGKAVAIADLSNGLGNIGVTLGSTITINVDGQPYDLEIIGVTQSIESNGMQAGFQFGSLSVPPGVLPTTGPQNFQMTLAEIEPEYLDEGLLELSSLPLVYSIDIAFIDGLLRRFIDQFSALPILVGLLSLLAAAVIMANTVALATLERRRQIGILKAVGLKGRRVLGLMLLENVLVSLLGGVLGIGLSALGVALMSSAGLQLAILVPTESAPWAILLVVAAVAIGAVATFLSAQVAINERVTNVLRYE